MSKIGLGFILSLAIFAAGMVSFTSAPAEAQFSDKTMNCMAQCIKDEGSSEKATCKSRCANVDMGGSNKKADCGVMYKTCRKACDKKDKACKKACKAKRRDCS
jgi:hypothetical protein